MVSFTTRPEIKGTFGVVASTHWLASAAGMAMLEKGGNAFDAAVAAAKELAGIDPDVTVRLVDYPRLRPWWQEMVRQQYDDEAAVMAFVEDLNEAFRTGVMETPGVLWMPPIYLR